MNAATNAAAALSWKLNKTQQPVHRGQPAFFVVGEVLRPHGVRGEVRMRVLTDNREQLPDLEYVYLADSAAASRKRQIAVNAVRFNKAYALLSFAGVNSRDAAEALRGKLVMIDVKQAPPLEEGQYFLYQLLGLRVLAEGRELGAIKEVLQTGANDVYLVESDEYGELLIPAHDETILSIDFDARLIRMSLPEGLIPG